MINDIDGHIEGVTETANDVLRKSKKNLYKVEKKHVMSNLSDFSFVVIGPPRVGKSTLINAITNKEVARTKPGFESCTKRIEEFNFNVSSSDGTPRTLHFYDVPGIESWQNSDVDAFLEELSAKTNPIAAFVLVSPGCFADKENFEYVIKTLAKKQMAIAFVLTNIYAGSEEQVKGMWEQLRLLAMSIKEGLTVETIADELIIWKNCLMVKVNAKDYQRKNPRGVLEIYEKHNVNNLLLNVFKLLTEDKVEGWCFALLENRSFWEKMHHQVQGFFQELLPTVWQKVRFELSKYVDIF